MRGYESKKGEKNILKMRSRAQMPKKQLPTTFFSNFFKLPPDASEMEPSMEEDEKEDEEKEEDEKEKDE